MTSGMTSAADSDLATAIALHRAGDFAAAGTAYQRWLADNPGDVTATHGLGLIALDLGRAADALPLFAFCVAREPDAPLYRTSYGLALMAQGDVSGAAAAFLEAANKTPTLAAPRLHLARALVQLKRPQEALEIFAGTAALFPDHGDVWLAKGVTERRLGRRNDAEKSLRRARAIDPHDTNVLDALAGLLKETARIDEALTLYEEALALAPNSATIRAHYGNALAAAGQRAAAERELREAIRIDPKSIDAPLGLGLLLTALERPAEAIPLFRKVLALSPEHTDAFTNLGVALLATGDTVNAETCYRRAIARAPDNAEAHYDLAWVLLLTGRWSEAWPHYAWRWKLPYFSSRKRGFRDVLWNGSPFKGTLLVHAEQGLGDTIQFARFLAAARARCDRIVFECQRPVARLLAGIAGADAVIAAGAPIPPFDKHIPLMSLPGALDVTPETIPAADGYLPVPSEIAPHVRLPESGGLRVGLVWAGSADNKIDRRRSIAAAAFAPLFSVPGIAFVSLQVGDRAAEMRDLPADRIVFDCNNRVRDFSETAAAIAQLDLVIGVDTAVIHLAGAMGKPTWIMLPFMPDFRWLLGRQDTPWYRSARLFRQEKAGDWAPVIARLAMTLTGWQPRPG